MLPHIPALRRGKPYASLDQTDVKDCRTGEPLARISQVNAGIVRKDLAKIAESRHALKELLLRSATDRDMRQSRRGYFFTAPSRSATRATRSHRSNMSKPCPPRAACRS